MKKRILPLVYYLSLNLLISACTVLPYSGSKNKKLAQDVESFSAFKYTISDQDIAGVTTGSKENPAVLFIHGSPGDWAGWANFLSDSDLLDKAFMIAVDRPGFGGSGRGEHEENLEKQAEVIIEAALKQHPGPFLLVGHSFGGPLVVQIAIDRPELTSDLLILAGSIDPDLEKIKWYQTMANSWAVRWLVPTDLDVTNQEILPLKQELIKQDSRLKNITQRVIFIQGETDVLVPPENADFAKNKFINAQVDTVMIPKEGHFLPWRQYQVVKDNLIKLLVDQ